MLFEEIIFEGLNYDESDILEIKLRNSCSKNKGPEGQIISKKI